MLLFSLFSSYANFHFSAGQGSIKLAPTITTTTTTTSSSSQSSSSSPPTYTFLYDNWHFILVLVFFTFLALIMFAVAKILNRSGASDTDNREGRETRLSEDEEDADELEGEEMDAKMRLLSIFTIN
jgi:large-conductance mechanosensitive channel